MAAELSDKARRIRLLITDVDGVLTDGGLLFDNQGQEYNSLDGHGIRLLLDCGIQVAVVTGRHSEIVNHRMNELGVEHIYQGYREKLPALRALLEVTQVKPDQVAYVGDDLPDLPVMQQVGLAIAVKNAHDFVKQHCDWVTSSSGGQGAIREIADFILQAQDLLDDRQQAYLE